MVVNDIDNNDSDFDDDGKNSNVIHKDITY